MVALELRSFPQSRPLPSSLPMFRKKKRKEKTNRVDFRTDSAQDEEKKKKKEATTLIQHLRWSRGLFPILKDDTAASKLFVMHHSMRVQGESDTHTR